MSIPYTPGSQPPIGHYLVTNTDTGERLWVGPDEFNWKDVPLVSELTKDQEARIQRLQWALKEHDPRPLDVWLHNFRCGVDPEAEIKVYEAILKTYREELAERKTVTKQERRLLCHTILNASLYGTLDNLLCAFPTAKCLAHLQRVFARYKENIGTSDRIELPVHQDNTEQVEVKLNGRAEQVRVDKSVINLVKENGDVINRNLALFIQGIEQGRLKCPPGTEQYWHFSVPGNDIVLTLCAWNKNYKLEFGVLSYAMVKELAAKAGATPALIAYYAPGPGNSAIFDAQGKQLFQEKSSGVRDGQHRTSMNYDPPESAK